MADENVRNEEVEEGNASSNPTTTEIDASESAGVAEGGATTEGASTDTQSSSEGTDTPADGEGTTDAGADTSAPEEASGDAGDEGTADTGPVLDENGYPEHQVPLPESDAPTQETTNEPLPDDHQDQVATNPEPETDEEGNVVTQVTQVANPEPEANTDEEEVFEDAPEIDQTRVTPAMLLIEVESEQYPVSLTTIFNKYSDRSFPQEPLLYDLQNLGYAQVQDVPRPEADVVSEGKPVLEDGVWKRTWEARDWNDNEKFEYLVRKQTSLADKVMALREKDCANGMPYSIDDGANTFHVQIRPSDKINLLGLNLEAQYAKQAGTTDAVFKFRSFENKSYMLTPDQMYDMTRASLSCILAIYDASWALKDAIDSATTVEELPTLPETLMPSTEDINKM